MNRISGRKCAGLLSEQGEKGGAELSGRRRTLGKSNQTSTRSKEVRWGVKITREKIIEAVTRLRFY